ncbi:MAG: 50S ribosomal protein L11 methyltransferase [Crocinitomicaceae bacterium]
MLWPHTHEVPKEEIEKLISENFPENKVQVIIQDRFIEQENWNAKWESDFEPVHVGDELSILAPFHDKSLAKKRIIEIMPKMSFGTGHHQTTQLMCSFLLEENVDSTKVLDMGTGTGILAILAEQLGASSILAVDIEDWSVENTMENAERNTCSKIQGRCGDIECVEENDFDIILANINRNILLRHLPSYSSKLKDNGILFLSGFFTTDADDLIKATKEVGLTLVNQKSKENWCALKFEKLI